MTEAEADEGNEKNTDSPVTAEINILVLHFI
jgi:hypothetical protein